MTAAVERTPVMDLAAMIRATDELVRQALRDRTWIHSPIGAEVNAYLRALRWQTDRTNTHASYEDVLVRLALRHADWDSLEDFCTPAGPEYLREFLDAEWGGCATSTKRAASFSQATQAESPAVARIETRRQRRTEATTPQEGNA